MRILILLILTSGWLNATVYFVSTAGGNYSSAGTWKVGSSGGGAGAVPTAADECDMDSGSGQLTIDASAVCRSFIASAGTTATLTMNANWALGDGTPGTGNVAFKTVSGMTFNSNTSTTLSFVSTSATQQTIDFTSSGQGPPSITFNGLGGSWKLLSAYAQNTNFGFTGLTLTAGSLDTNGQTITCDSIQAGGSSTRSLTLGASSITNKGGAVNNSFSPSTGLTLNAGTSTINMYSGGGTNVNLGTGLTFATIFYAVEYTGGNSPSNFTTGAGTVFGALTMWGPSFNTVGVTNLSSNFVVTGNLSIEGDQTSSGASIHIQAASPVCIQGGAISQAHDTLTNVTLQTTSCAGATPVRHKVNQGGE